jgi:hypothetical protein
MALSFEAIRKFVSRAPAAAPQRSEIMAGIAAAEAEIGRTNLEIERLAAERRNVLIHGNDADLEKHDALAASEMRARDRASALKDELAGRLAEVDAATRQKEIEQERAAVEKLVEAACAELRKYPALASQMVDILIVVAKSDAAVRALNDKYPDQAPIADAESKVRFDPGPAKKILSEKTVNLWADHRGNPVAAIYQEKVVPCPSDSKKGKLSISSFHAEDVELRPFRRIEFLPEQSSWTPTRLDQSLVLPGFYGSAPNIYAPNLRDSILSLGAGQNLRVVPPVSRAAELEFVPIISNAATPADDSESADVDPAIDAA